MATMPLDTVDLELVFRETRHLWEEMRNRSIFITGGTGFFGRWLLESFLYINRALDLNASATVLSRNPAAFAQREPHVANDPAITLIAGDVTSYVYPEGDFHFVIHAATEVAAITDEPLARLNSIQQGTAHTLRFAATHSTRRFLLTSSGAVYGRLPASITHVPEDYTGAPETTNIASVYGEAKRTSELMCALYAASTPIEFTIARCFALVGPGLALDSVFALGNFVADILAGRNIAIEGDGTPMRSYLYAADLAIWIWTMLFRAPSMEVFNLGSEDAISIADLARKVADTLNPSTTITVAKQMPSERSRAYYVPSTQKAQRMLALRQNIDLEESIRRMARWYGYSGETALQETPR